MVDYREILRLQSLGYNITQITGLLHSSRNTVREVERLADQKGIRWPLGEKATNPQLYVLLYPERQEKANVYLEPDCAWIHRELAKKRSEPDIAFERISGQLLQYRACPIPVYSIYSFVTFTGHGRKNPKLR